MNLRQARKELLANVRAGNAVILESPSGLGKSQMLYQVFSAIKAEDAAKGINWGLGVIFAATQTPPDLIGFQFKGERDFGDGKKITVTEASCPLWCISVPHGDDPGGKPAWMYDRFFLIIDEYGQGEADTKRGIAEIFLNGGTAPWYLPQGSVRVAATNVGVRYGVGKDFDFCIARRSLLRIIGDVAVWIEDFADKPYWHQGRQWQVMPVTKVWAMKNPQILFEPEPKEQGPWCNPRTLCSADRYVQVRTEMNGGKIPADDPSMQESMAGIIGQGATSSLINHFQFRLELPSYQDVVADPDGTPVPTRADLLMLMAYEMAGWTQVDHLPQCIKYIQRMSAKAKDMEVTYITALLRRDYRGLINQPAMQGWINKNASLVNIVASLAQN